MTFLEDSLGEVPAAAPARPRVAVRSRRGLLLIALGSSGWLLLVPLTWRARVPLLGGFYVGVSILLVGFLLAALVSITAVLAACVRRSWGVASVIVAVAVTAVVVVTRQGTGGDYIDHQYRTHRAALVALAGDYRAGRLDGALELPADVRSLCPSGFAYADRGAGVLFVQVWQNWRAESGTGFAYLVEPPTDQTRVTTASGDFGHPRREVGDGWWWVA